MDARKREECFLGFFFFLMLMVKYSLARDFFDKKILQNMILQRPLAVQMKSSEWR